MRVLCCGEVGSRMTIRDVSSFLSVVGIGIVAGSILRTEVGFEGELASWFFI